MDAPVARARTVALATSHADEGWGGVWPVATLVGASSAAALACGAWLGAAVSALGAGVPLPSFVPWVAEHALWGTALGAAVTLGLRLGSARNPLLRLDANRRSVAARATPCGVAIGFALALLFLSETPVASLGPALGIAAGGVAWGLAVRRWSTGPGPLGSLPRLDAVRVAALVALLTVPLAIGRAPLFEGWRAVLAP